MNATVRSRFPTVLGAGRRRSLRGIANSTFAMSILESAESLKWLDYWVVTHLEEEGLDIRAVARDEGAAPKLIGDVLELHLMHGLERNVGVVAHDSSGVWRQRNRLGRPPGFLEGVIRFARSS